MGNANGGGETKTADAPRRDRRGSAGGGGGGGGDVSREVATVQTLRNKISDLEKRQAFLEKKMQQEVEQGRAKLKAGNKAGATQHLKRKKLYEKEVAHIFNMMDQLEQQAMALERGTTTAEVVRAMKTGRDVQKVQAKEIDVDAVKDLQDEIAELQQDADEVQNIFATASDPLLDAEIEDDLAALELEEGAAPEKIKTKPAGAKAGAAKAKAKAEPVEEDAEPDTADLDALPAVPSHKVKVKVPVKADDDEDDLRALEKEFS